MMDKAIEADGKNPLPMYQRAQILISLERYDLALEELHRLEGIVPKESTIFALMGKIYKHLNMHHKAMFYFGIALDLKPPAADAASIKVHFAQPYSVKMVLFSKCLLIFLCFIIFRRQWRNYICLTKWRISEHMPPEYLI